MTINFNRDDLQLDRLFFHLAEHLNFPLKSMKKINEKVFIIRLTNYEQPFVIKKFPTYNKLKKQKLLTDYLVSSCFPTYAFMHESDYLFRDGNFYYAILQYLPKHEAPFTFEKEIDRNLGLNLLEHFHWETRKFVRMVADNQLTIFPKLNLEEKWKQRLDFFISQEKFTTNFIAYKHFQEIINWGQWALRLMGEFRNENSYEQPTIIHGDVAHHNFLRTVNNRLFLIDFDLAAYAFPIYDYLQYALRITPFTNWDFESLLSHSVLQKYKENRWFWAALSFPNEIIREWNQLIRQEKYRSEKWLTYTIRFVYSRFSGQQYIFNKIRNMLS